eukprot:181368_1
MHSTSKVILLCFTIFIIAIATCIQLILTLNNWSIQHLFFRALISSAIYYARATSLHYLSSSDIFKHNICLNPYTNQTTSCELVGYNIFFRTVLPDWDYIRESKPETFITYIRTPIKTEAFYNPPFGVIYEDVTIDNINCLLIHEQNNVHTNPTHSELFSNGLIIYFHGGGFIIGSAFENHKFLTYLHLFSGLPILGIDYRLSPEYPIYDAVFLDDAKHIITQYLHHNLSIPYSNIYLVGDSAGGALSLLVMQQFSLDEDFDRFGGGILISPAVNLTDNLISPYEGYDTFITESFVNLVNQYQYQCRNVNGIAINDEFESVEECVEYGKQKIEEKELNLISNDWSKMNGSNMVFMVSEYELLIEHSLLGHEKALRNNINSQLHVIPNVSLHVLPIFGQFADIPEAMKSVSQIAHIIKDWNRN